MFEFRRRGLKRLLISEELFRLGHQQKEIALTHLAGSEKAIDHLLRDTRLLRVNEGRENGE
ncbi:MAG: hypothetical protein A4E57_02905 [Syntrophorhabdaceae bacterium PtaU1.Bin034]|nr:MAG: hypothetical protein A4E57_02905 [Syntrophorhabdaceae bacterium PtaU1.Bin034]